MEYIIITIYCMFCIIVTYYTICINVNNTLKYMKKCKMEYEEKLEKLKESREE
jgi:hypothetical protein